MHVLLLPAFKGTLAFATVSFFSLFMKVSWTRAAATQFTLYMAMSNLGYALGAKLITWLELSGFNLSLVAFTCWPSVPLIPLLVGLDPDGVEERRLAERCGSRWRRQSRAGRPSSSRGIEGQRCTVRVRDPDS